MGEQIYFKETGTQELHQSEHLPDERVKGQASPFDRTMISKTVDQLKLTGRSVVLEIGFKNREYLPFLFQKVEGVSYYGNNISEASVLDASLARVLKIKEGTAQFSLAKEDGRLDFGTDFFDGCFTANTIYLWKDPLAYLKEIYRVLQPGGKLGLSFMEKNIGTDLPWTRADFTFYSAREVKTFFSKAGFIDIEEKQMTEEITSQNGQSVSRPFICIVGKK